MTKDQKKKLTKSQEKLLQMPIGSFVQVDMFIGDDPEPYPLGMIYEAHLGKLTKLAQSEFEGARFEIATISFTEGSFLRENGRGKNNAPIARLLADVLSLTFEKPPKPQPQAS